MAGSAWADVPENVARGIFHRVGDRMVSPTFPGPEEVPYTGAGLDASRLVCRRWSVLSTESIRTLRPKRIFPGMVRWRSLTVLDLRVCDMSSLSKRHGRYGRPGHSWSVPVAEYIYDHGIRIDTIDLRGRADDTILRMLGPFRGLTNLDLGGCHNVTRDGLEGIRHITALSTLSLNGIHLQQQELEEVARHTSLTSLDLHTCYLTDDAVLQLRPLTALTKLVLTLSTSVTDAGVAVVQWMPHLRVLEFNSLSSMGDVTDSSIIAIAGLTNLTALSLMSTNCMTPVGLRALCTQLTALTSLDLTGCGCKDLRPPPVPLPPILDEHLAWISTYLPRLKVLDLYEIGTSLIDADGEWHHPGGGHTGTITAAGVALLRVQMPGCEINYD